MRSRSGMAARALVAVCILGYAGIGRASEADEVVENKVHLDLQISGIGPEGCEVQIKAGHSGCRFSTVTKRVESAGEPTRVGPITVSAKSTSADHDCSFVITLKEPGQKARTYRRGIQLKPAGPGGQTPVQTLKCHLSAPSLAAKDDPAGRTRR